MAKFILAIKKILNLLPFIAPSENPPEGYVDLYLGGDNNNDLMALKSDGETITLAEGTVVSTEE